MQILFNDDTIIDNILTEKIYKVAELCLNEENINEENIEISISFVDNDEIKNLNAQYRNINEVTDVLSFPQFDNKESIHSEKSSLISLGDVVISLDKAVEQALEFGHSKEREIIYLVVHSIFHLLGYDHMNDEDKEVMRGKEENIMKKIQLIR